jgi:beta-lactamase superfamily II metal-dependent hydrolase
MSVLRIRAYNVRFGDAILLSIPERDGGREVTRHLLFDVGNVLSGEGGPDTVFEPVVRDILEVLGGEPLDLYVMSHEHMDHVQGLLYASQHLGLDLEVRHAWLPASAEEGYYERHPDAKQRRLDLQETLGAIERFFRAAADKKSPLVEALLLNNDWRSTDSCVAFLRGIAAKTTYVYRGRDLQGEHPFTEAQLSVWAPEEDTTAYYGRFQPMALGVTGAEEEAPALETPLPPAGVDAGTFYRLIEMRQETAVDNLLAIDRANNNTSVVVSLEWRGWRLLFPGDAEQRSWKEMNKQGVLQPVHFLKVGHHGSWNGTPPPSLLDVILPVPAPDARPRRALVSTCADTYHNVPDDQTIDEIRQRADVVSVGEPVDPAFVDIEFKED